MPPIPMDAAGLLYVSAVLDREQISIVCRLRIIAQFFQFRQSYAGIDDAFIPSGDQTLSRRTFGHCH